jgi:hypothetical protein
VSVADFALSKWPALGVGVSGDHGGASAAAAKVKDLRGRGWQRRERSTAHRGASVPNSGLTGGGAGDGEAQEMRSLASAPIYSGTCQTLKRGVPKYGHLGRLFSA